MARLPRFQESGLISADIPRMDFANVREQSRQSEVIGSALTRISEFAFGRVQKEREEQNRLIGMQARSELEAEVQKRMADLTIRVETGQITNFNEIQSEVASMRGLAIPLAEISPEQAQGLMQSIATSGRSLLAKSSDVMVKAYQAGVQVQIDELNSAVGKTLETAYEVTQNPEELARIESDTRAKVYALGVQAPALLPKAIEGFEATRRAAERSAMTKYLTSPDFGATETERLAKLDAGDAGKFSNLWNAKPETERLEIKKQMYETTVARLQAKKRDVEAKKIADDETYVSTYKEYLLERDPRKKAELAKTLVASADSVADIERVLKTGESGGDVLLFSNLREDVRTGRITDHRQLQRFVGPNGIDKTQLNSLQTELYSRQDRQLSSIRSRIREQSGIGQVSGFFDPREARVVKKEAITSRFEQRVAQAEQRNRALPPEQAEPIDYDKILNEAIEDYNQTDAKNMIVKSAQAKLDLYQKDAAKRGRDVVINQDTNIEDLRRLKIFKDDQLDNIRKQIEIIRDNQTK